MNRQAIYEIKEIDGLIVRKNIKMFKELSNTGSIRQRLVVFYMMEHKNEKIYQRDLEKFLDVRRSTVSGILKTMEKNNLIIRCDDLADGRLKEVKLTEKAKIEFKKIQDRFLKMESDLVLGISDEDLHTFFKVIDKIKENLKGGENV